MPGPSNELDPLILQRRESNRYNQRCSASILECCAGTVNTLYPPVPAALPRMVPKPGHFSCERFLPAGTSVGLPHYSCYHSAQNFFEPEVFHPERWLEAEDPRFKDDRKDAFHPFSHGPRKFSGKK